MNDKNARIQPMIDWSAVIWSAIIAGVVFMILEMIMVSLFAGGSPWGPPRMIAAIGLGNGVLPPPATFDFSVMLVAVVIHLILAFIYALILAFILTRWAPVNSALWVGLVFGLALYLVNFYGFTLIFPWFAMARNWITLFTHVVFGGVLGWSYQWLQSPR